MKKVSVIIPTYKRSQDIQRAVDSVLNQDYPQFEVIVVDDNGVASPDGELTKLKMQKYEHDSRVKYLRHKVNKNGSAARNTGLNAAEGDYISFLDDDDAYRPSRLSKLVAKMESLGPEWGACYSSYVKIFEDGRIQNSGEKVEGDIFIQTLMRSFYLGSGSNIFVRRSVIDDIGLFDETFLRNQDLEFLIRVTKRYKMAYVDDILMEAYYDIRTTKLSIDQYEDKEKYFLQKFGPDIDSVSDKEKHAIFAMYDLDWIRLCLEKKCYGRALKTVLRGRIPLSAYVGYLKYAYDRKRTGLCYGYVVKL